MNPLVSILIPAYNAETWVADAIKSAMAQTWPRKEIIVVDDGSTDRTLPVAKQYASRTVSVITQENQGAAGARNSALALAQGDYVQWLDADDLLAPDKVAKQMEAVARSGDARMLPSGAWAHFFYRSTRAEFVQTPLWCNLTPAEWLTRKLELNLHMQTANWLVSRELTQAAGPWDVRLFRDNDGEYFCRVILASSGVTFVPAARSYYRRSGPLSVSYIGRSNKKLDSLFLSMQLHIKYLLSLEDSPRTRHACLTYLHTWTPHYYPERPDVLSQIAALASTLGGELVIPNLSRKYVWLQHALGYSRAKRARLLVRRVKDSCARSWDRVMFQVEGAVSGSVVSSAPTGQPQ
jgi:glycosyltransferase involved in cell wall biosynthesis